MSTVLCKNHTATTLQLKLEAAQPPESRKNLATEFDIPKNNEFGTWGCGLFLQKAPKEPETDNRAWAQKSKFSSLSAKSLQLCTENLGSETGCETVAGGDFFSFASGPALMPIKSTSSDRYSAPVLKEDGIGADNCDKWKKITRFPKNSNHNFPPPLTSSLQVRRHSEGGRLIMEVVEAPFRNSYMQAERSEGRLRLCFVMAEVTASVAAGDQEKEEDVEAAEEEEEEDEVEESEINNNSEMEKEKFQWIRRCTERGRHGSKWKPAVWVAIS